MDEIFHTQTVFADLGLSPEILRGLDDLGFTRPTHIQAELIPVALTGKDVLGQAKTGTGKTAAFGLPLLQMIDSDESLAAMVLVPTRELAVQVTAELADLAKYHPVKAVTIYGGQAIKSQVDALRSGPGIVVGTPGRVMDMHQRGYLSYENMRYAVLDEVDRMLDIGFRDDIRKILGALGGKSGKRPQTIFVSATISPEIEKLARTHMRDPVKIVTAAKSLTVSQVRQSYIAVEPWDKTRLLVHLLKHETPELTVVFCRTKRTVDLVAKAIQKAGIDAHAIHGDMFQRKRNEVMEKLRDGNLEVLVASDLAARGLDVDDISHVINFDLPEDPEVYVHRIGRTARAGRNGIAWAFVSPEQGELLTSIESLINQEIPRLDYPGFAPGPVPGEVQARRDATRKRQDAPPVTRDVQANVPTSADDQRTAERYPGGQIPTAAPLRRLGGKVRTRRR